VRLFVSGESWQERTEQILGVRPGAPPASSGGEAGHGEHAMHGGHAMHAAGATAGHAMHGEHAMHDGGATPGADATHGADATAGHAMQGEHAMHDGGAAPGADATTGHAMPPGHAMAGMPMGHSMAFFRIATHSSFALTTDGLVDAPGMGKVLADRATALSKDPAHEDVLILAHGPGDDAENARWLAKLDERAAAIRTATPFRRVQVETLREDWPDKRAAAEERIRAFVKRAADEGGTAIVVPFRVQGFGPYKQVLDGLTYVSDGQGLIPHAEVGAWIEQEIEALRTGSFLPTVAH
jgi:hypothetical protein